MVIRLEMNLNHAGSGAILPRIGQRRFEVGL